MVRRNFLRNVVLGIAASLLPKVLQPLVPEVIEEEMVDVPIEFSYVIYTKGTDSYRTVKAEYEPNKPPSFFIRLTKAEANRFVAGYQSKKVL